jgi:hypothetical protein
MLKSLFRQELFWHSGCFHPGRAVGGTKMKINDRLLDGSMIQGELTEKTDGPSPGTAVPDPAPAELPEVRHPKADSVELKTNSFYNFDQAAKLDPAKTNISGNNEVPAAMIPGVPFREKVELPKTLPNGTSVDKPVGSDLGFGKKRTGPDHMGIDMKGTTIKNQLDDALKLREGSQQTNSGAPKDDAVNFNSIGSSHARDDKTYHAGFNLPGNEKKAWGEVDKNPFKTLTKLPEIVEKVTGRAADFLDGIKALVNPNEQEKKYLNEKEGDGIQVKGYTNPDAPEENQPPVVTDELLHSIDVRFDSNKRPSNEDLSLGTIDASKLSTTDPRWKLVSNPNPESDSNTATGTGQSIDVMNNVKGPDSVNPRDPELGGGSTPITLDPNRPK